MGPFPTSTDDQGQVSAQVAVSNLPGINFAVASASGGSATVFGAASVLQPVDFFKQVEAALSVPPLSPASLLLRELLNKAQDQLKNNDVVGAVVTLENSPELLAQAESQLGGGPTAPGTSIDLLKRLLNQVILLGANLGDVTGTISCGKTVSGTLAPAQQDFYKFSANVGEVIAWASVPTSGSLDPCADLYASGKKIVTGTCNGVSGPFTIPTTGTYTLVVHDFSYSNTGNYNLNLQFPTGRCATSTACGQTKSATLVPAQQDAYSFSAKVGEVVTFPSVVTSGSIIACADLYASGKKIASNPCDSVNAPFTIPTTGSYIFVVHDANYFNGGTYNLNLQFPTGRCATSTACNQTKSGTLVAAQQDAYSFSAINGQVITFASVVTSGSLDPCADLYASGKKIASNPCNNVSAPVTIPTTGKYIFVVHDARYFNTGNYNANWHFTTGCPTCSVSPASLSFATQLLGTTSAPKSATLTNTGNATMSITSIGITGTNPVDFTQSNTCGTSLAVGHKCIISASFKPTATGKRTAAVSIADNAEPPNPQTVGLTGTGTEVKLVPTSLSFGSQKVGTTSAPKSVTMTNVGTTVLTISGISLTGTNAGDFSQTHTCGGTLGAGASCTISVTFHPSATGARSAALSISDNGGGSPQKVPLSGTGT
jgi:hypothetical protein